MQSDERKSFDPEIKEFLKNMVFHFDDENRRDAQNAFDCYQIISRQFKINIRDLFNLGDATI